MPCEIDPTPADPDGTPNDCVPSNQTLFIPNVTTDFGLSPPYNSLFTIFGQFFDHGLDKITNGGSGTVFVPLKADDPLVVNGPDGDPQHTRRGSAAAGVHGADPRHEHHRRQRRTQLTQHRLALRRSEPDLHVALVAPGLPARVRLVHRRTVCHRQVPLVGRWRSRQLGDDQGAGRDASSACSWSTSTSPTSR